MNVVGYLQGNLVAKCEGLTIQHFDHGQFIKNSQCPKTKKWFAHFHCYSQVKGKEIYTTIIVEAEPHKQYEHFNNLKP